MVYAYDRNILMPTKDLYDTQIMAMAVAAAKDLYDNARQEIKDFNKLYGDFITPIAKDQEWYDKNVTGMFLRELDNMYAQGIDPLRSVEGRSRIFKLANSIPTGVVNTMKANAALYEKRLAELSKLGDKYDRSMDITLYGDPTQFSTVGPNGEINTFNYAPPSAYQTIDELIEPVIKNIKPIYDETYTKQKNDGNDWYTITKDRMMEAVDDSMSDILATPSGKFQYILSQREAEAIGRPELATQIFKDKIKNRLSDHEYIEPKANPFAVIDYRAAKSLSTYKQKLAAKALADGDSPNPYEQSYARDIYTTSLGKIFGDDAYTASYKIEDGTYGKKIFNKEGLILKRYGFDVDKSIAAHTSKGNYKSNAVMIGIPLGGHVKVGQKVFSLSSSSQFTKEALGQKKIYDASDLVFNNAGYAKSNKDRNDDQQENKKNISSALYYTVTDDVVGQYEKNGQYKTYTKVIGDNGAVGYVGMGVNSNRKQGGAAFSSPVKNRTLDLGYDKMNITSMKQRDLLATKLYTKQGSSNNNGALEPEMTDEDIDDLDAE